MLYESEFTKFMRDYQDKNPQTREAQIQGRAILWDKEVDHEAQARYVQARVKQKPYVYQTKG